MEIPIDRAVFEQREMRAALTCHDIGTVYRLLKQAGISQRRIAALTGQSQSQVSEIAHGRRVYSYNVLERIADGLGVPRGVMGLSYGADGAYAEEPKGTTGIPVEEVTEDMKRRAFLAAAAAALAGRPGLGEVLELPTRPDSPTPLPSQLGTADVDAMRDLRDRLRTVAQAQGGYLDMLGPVAQRGERLLTVPATAQTSRALAVAVSELHAMAGWAGFDAHLDDTARHHFGRAIALSSQADDPYSASYAAYLSGVLNEERGHPNDALKLFQLGRVRLSDARDDPRTPSLRAWLLADSAGALVNMDRPDDARSELTAARDSWRPSSTDEQAELDFVSALVEIGLGRTETAEQLAASAVRHRNGTPDRRASLVERITWSQIHVGAGEARGKAMAEQVIRDVAELRSNRARDRLVPLADALDARRDSQSRELAVAARRVAVAQA